VDRGGLLARALVARLVGGSLADRFGRRRVFSIRTILFAAASLSCALSPNVVWLIVARGLQEIGGALWFPRASRS
jgi:MFS family permease